MRKTQSRNLSIALPSHLAAHLLILLHSIIPYSGGTAIADADYQGLQAFKLALEDPGGRLRSWNGTSLDACSGSWAGIKCFRGQVVAIQLPWSGLGGRITDKMTQFVALRKLNLHDNGIGGQIPAGIGSLPHLRGLYLFNNRFSGTIPPSIGHLPVLHNLDLSNNFLTGTIPPSITNSTSFYRLNLSYNNLVGPIPASLTRSPSLVYLSLQHNNLSGSIPTTWGGTTIQMYMLKELNLAHNSLTGTIPNSIANLYMLETLDLSCNSITGGLPISLFGMRNLSVLSLNGNAFRGEIPPTLGNISSLSVLDLSQNNLSGEIPDSFARLTNLSSFNVSHNNLSGIVPRVLSQKFNSSSFTGNVQLCGYSMSYPCHSTSPLHHLPQYNNTKHEDKKLSTRNIVFIVAGCVISLLLLCCVFLLCWFRKRGTLSKKSAVIAAGAREGKSGTGAESNSEAAGGKLVHFEGHIVFTADDLLCATAEIMGKSTYGTVYKATLEDGNQVAVKRMREKITHRQKEFEAEASVLGKIRHQNLLPLRAYYLGPKGEKLLVFDYMPKGSLAAFLHARGTDAIADWETRMSIAMGIAQGLRCLHMEHNMIHGNLTTSNVLLDETSTAKIADYGISLLIAAGATATSTPVAATAGSVGYRAPELAKMKKAADMKSDIYSLGVILLELLTGKSPGDAVNGVELPQWVAAKVKEECTNEVFDLEVMRDAGGGTSEELLNTLKLALHCVDPSPAARPEIQQVVQQLAEMKPGFAHQA